MWTKEDQAKLEELEDRKARIMAGMESAIRHYAYAYQCKIIVSSPDIHGLIARLQELVDKPEL